MRVVSHVHSVSAPDLLLSDKRLFETKRKDQLNALKNLVELNDINQQYKIIDIMLKGLFKVGCLFVCAHSLIMLSHRLRAAAKSSTGKATTMEKNHQQQQLFLRAQPTCCLSRLNDKDYSPAENQKVSNPTLHSFACFQASVRMLTQTRPPGVPFTQTELRAPLHSFAEDSYLCICVPLKDNKHSEPSVAKIHCQHFCSAVCV